MREGNREETSTSTCIRVSRGASLTYPYQGMSKLTLNLRTRHGCCPHSFSVVPKVLGDQSNSHSAIEATKSGIKGNPEEIDSSIMDDFLATSVAK